jgi:hypothetical protein
MSKGCDGQPLTLWAGVGKALVIEVIELARLGNVSEVIGDGCDGLWGV